MQSSEQQYYNNFNEHYLFQCYRIVCRSVQLVANNEGELHDHGTLIPYPSHPLRDWFPDLVLHVFR